MVACQDIPSEVKKQIFFILCFPPWRRRKKKKNTGRASFEISEAAYSTGYGKTGKTIPNPMLHDVKGYQHWAELRV